MPITLQEIAHMVDAKLVKEMEILHTRGILTKRVYDTRTAVEVCQVHVEKPLEIKVGNPMPEVKVQVMAGLNTVKKVSTI